MEIGGFKPKKSASSIVGASIYSLIVLYSFGDLNISFSYLLFIFPLLVVLVVIELFRKSETPVSNFAFSIVGIMYIVIPFSILNFFAYNSPYDDVMELEGRYEFIFLLGFFVIQWASDTGAYLFGSAFGKTKLFERVSPNKTWEGAVGGMLLAMTTGFLFAYFSESSIGHWIAVSSIIVVFGTLGDLTESQIKRSCGVKDSGTILPGHGGILDRFDGVLFSAPFVLAYLHIFDLL